MDLLRQIVRKVPILRSLRRRYSNYKGIALCGLAGGLLGLVIGVHIAQVTSGRGTTLLGHVRTALNRSFAPNIAVAGHQKDGSFVLCNFEAVNDFKLWTVGGAMMDVSSEHASEGGFSGRVTFYGGAKLSSVAIEDFFESRYALEDWTPYGALAFSVFNPEDKPLRLILQVKDHYGTPFKEDVMVPPGMTQRVVVPFSRMGQVIKLRRVASVTFFVWEEPSSRQVYLDDVRLLPGGAA